MYCRFYGLHKYIWAAAGESCLLVLSWMPLCGRGRGLRLLGKLGKEGGLGANGWDGGKNPWEKGLSGCVGRREQAPKEVMEGRWLFQDTAWTLWDWFDLEAVKPAGWQSRACGESITCLAWGGLAGGGFIPLGGLGFLHLKNSSLLFGK